MYRIIGRRRSSTEEMGSYGQRDVRYFQLREVVRLLYQGTTGRYIDPAACMVYLLRCVFHDLLTVQHTILLVC